MKLLVTENEIYNISDFDSIKVVYDNETFKDKSILTIKLEGVDVNYQYWDVPYREGIESSVTNLIARSIANDNVIYLDEIMEGFEK